MLVAWFAWSANRELLYTTCRKTRTNLQDPSLTRRRSFQRLLEATCDRAVPEEIETLAAAAEAELSECGSMLPVNGCHGIAGIV